MTLFSSGRGMLATMTSAARVLALLLCVLSLSMLACSKRAAGVSAEAPADYAQGGEFGGSFGTGGDTGGDYEYRNDMDMVTVDAVGTEAPAPRRESKQRFERERSSKDVDFKSAPAPDEPAPEQKPGSDGQLEPLEPPSDAPKQPAQVASKRQIIYTATMQVSVYDLEHSLEIVEDLPERYGGWMHQRVDNQIVLRIPADRLAEVMATVAELGVVDYRLLESLDVTAEYTDLESRIQILAEIQKQLQSLLTKAATVEQALEIRRALDQVTLELEAARAQMRELSKSIAFSTLILSLVERGPTQLVPSRNDPFPWVDELGVEATDYR
jgi:hypothetical protein